MNYAILTPEVENDPLGLGYDGMTNQQVVDSMNGLTRTETYSRFCSIRTAASVLSNSEFDELETFLLDESTSSRITKMVEIFQLSGSDGGSRGGLDFGDPGIVALLDKFANKPGMETIAETLKALAERSISRATELGIGTVGIGHINRIKGA